jgi:eukaryotic-like serine/threonine-protein kinase
MIGQTLLHYEVLEKLGEGAMGVLYRARDIRLDRDVAIKVLRPEVVADPGRRRRLVREARAASALNHPHIVTVHDVGRAALDGGEVDFIAMECLPGRGLDRALAERPFSVDEALEIGLQVTGALASAHAAGIVHRDIKPANVMLSDAGVAKVLDFGLATGGREPGAGGECTASDDPASTSEGAPSTRPGAPVGTPAYMSPEAAEGQAADERSDVFALGVVLYEILAGRRPFPGESRMAVLAAVLRDAPPPLRSLRKEVPRDVERVVMRCLAKRPADRYASAGDLLLDLTECRARFVARTSGWRAAIRQPRMAAALALATATIAALSTWTWVRGAPKRRAREEVLPQIARLLDQSGTETGNYQAYWLARAAAPHLRGDAQLERFWKDRCYPLTLRTRPPGAQVFVKEYRDPSGEWQSLGRTPLEDLVVPYDVLRWRVEKDGFEPVEVTTNPASPSRSLDLTLDAAGTAPPGMVRVAGRRLAMQGFPIVTVGDFWLDRYEVTNRRYREFVEQGGYHEPEYWKVPFVKDGRTLSWPEGMAAFVDSSGRPGPATWEAGTFPEGEDDLPVGGVSFFEAAAYAAFAGKDLPTFFHWVAAFASPFSVSYPVTEIFSLSNFGGKGPVAVGTMGGLSPWGNLDMAGNVREWSRSESRGRRYALGGAWTDPPRTYLIDNAQSPWMREPTDGFRCARYEAPVAPELTAAVEMPQPDYSKQKPASEQVFQAYAGFYAYDPADPRAHVESVSETPHWRRERVSFEAAYGNERVPAHLFIPRNVQPPYQAVVYSPTIEAFNFRSSDDIRTTPFDYIVRSGRAVLHPIYPGTYERQLKKPIAGPSDIRDLVIQSVKDVRRGLDYLETRSDMDRTRLAMLGISDTLSIIAPALDPRLKATVIQGGGLVDQGRPAEADPFHFAPRVKAPALILAGEHDPLLESVRGPRLLKLLGTPAGDKRLVFVDSGHSARRSHQIVRETLDWLDRHLGPVAPIPSQNRR